MAKGESFIGKADLEFVLGDTSHGGYVLGEGAAAAVVAVNTSLVSGRDASGNFVPGRSIKEALKTLRTDAEQNGTVDYNLDGTPIRGSKRGHHRTHNRGANPAGFADGVHADGMGGE